MKFTKIVLGSLAAAGLIAAQPAFAAGEPARATAPTDEEQQMGAASSPIGIIAGILAILLVLELTEVIDILESNDAEPASP